MPVDGFSRAIIFGTNGSCIDLTSRPSTTVNAEHEYARIDSMGCSMVQWKPHEIGEKCIFLSKLKKINYFSRTMDFDLEIGYSIGVQHTRVDGTGPSSIGSIGATWEQKNSIDEFEHFLPMESFSWSSIVETMWSYHELVSGHCISVNREHESAKIGFIEHFILE